MSNQNKLKELGFEFEKEYRGHRMYVKILTLEQTNPFSMGQKLPRRYAIWIAEKDNSYSIGFSDSGRHVWREALSFSNLAKKVAEFQQKLTLHF